MGGRSPGSGPDRCLLHGLCLIIDRKAGGCSPGEMTRTALDAGVRWIQYREKERTRREIYREARELGDMVRQFGGLFIVNDHADIALAVRADGVHLGQDDLPLREAKRIMGGKIIGISTHSLDQAREAEKEGADYIGFGPMFPTDTKDAGTPKGLEMLKEIRRQVRIPIAAIGGITAENVGEVLRCGADAVAVISAILRGDIAENVRAFMARMGN